MMRIRLIMSVLGILAWQHLHAAQGGLPRALEYWADASSEQIQAYPLPVPVTVVPRAEEVPQLRLGDRSPSSLAASPQQSNEAIRVQAIGSAEQSNLFGTVAEFGSAFLVLQTRWENVHPKEKVARDKLEGKVDRTMGVGGLGGGGRSSGPAEYVDMDVAYKVPRLNDHVYVLADGQAIALHPVTATLPGGAEPTSSFGIAKHGEVKELRLAYLIPENSKNVALQFFDYNNGHLLIPLRGDAELARNSQEARAGVLDEIATDVVELAAHRLAFADDYQGEAAGSGWRFAVVQLGGQSLSRGGNMASILQFDPSKYMWVTADGGFIYYASAGSTDAKGNIRFTPEIYQRQEVAFRVPESTEHLSMGLRINRDVVTLSLTDRTPASMPEAKMRHEDGDVMEILLYGTRREGDYLIVDLGIKPVIEGQGLEVRTSQQFLLQTADGELRPDTLATAELPGHPPAPFVVPPGAPVRFELAYRTAASPTALRLRGFRGEGKFEL
ncbi:MAG: hypothetical protein ACE5FV_12385 [Woeseia sp.]